MMFAADPVPVTVVMPSPLLIRAMDMSFARKNVMRRHRGLKLLQPPESALKVTSRIYSPERPFGDHGIQLRGK